MSAVGSNILQLVLLLAPLGSAGQPTDLAALIDPAAYFPSRRIETGAPNMLMLASGTPRDARGEFQRAQAIRWLGDNADRLGEHHAAVYQVLVRHAREADELTADRARLALARLEGRPLPALRAAPHDSLREALDWFPADVRLVGVLDTRAPVDIPPGQPDVDLERQFQRVRASLLNALPGESREGLYGFAEAVGNCRLDRLAFGIVPAPWNTGHGQIFLRGTGRFHHARLAAYLRQQVGRDVLFVQRTGLRGEPITLVGPKNQPPACALVRDEDVILAGYVMTVGDSTALIDQMLAVRDGGRPGVRGGPLAEDLHNLARGQRGLFRGRLPGYMVADLARSPLGARPYRLAADVLAAPGGGAGLELRLRATFDSEADARRFADGLRSELRQAVEALKELPLVIQLAGVAAVRQAVEQVEVRADGPAVAVRVQVSAATLKALLGLLEMAPAAYGTSGGPHG
jgi:hypothetical protein